MTTTQVANIFTRSGIPMSKETVRLLVHEGKLRALRISDKGWLRITKDSVSELAQSRGIDLTWEKDE